MKRNKIKNSILLLHLLFFFALKVNIAFTQNRCKIQIANNFKNDAVGNTITISDDSIKIHYPFYLDEPSVDGETLVFSKKISKVEMMNFCTQVSELDMFSLESKYELSGVSHGINIYFDIEIDNRKKQIHIFEYYHLKIGKMIYLVNKFLPKKFKIDYDKKYK